MFPALSVSFTILFLFAGSVFAQVCVEPLPNMVSWWSLDETSGTVADDIVGTNPGVHVNGPVNTSGKVVGALKFDGINDFVGVPDSDLWAFGPGDFTIEFWANFSSLGGGTIGHPSHIFIGNDEGSGLRAKWFFALGGGFLSFHINSPSLGPQFFPLAAFSPTINQWYHLAITRESNNYTIYINGQPAASAANNNIVPNANAALTIGQAENLGFMNGMLDEMIIYHRALSADGIRSIFLVGEQGKCKKLTIRTEFLSTIKLGEYFEQKLEAVSGITPLLWEVVAGQLPAGMSFTSDGVLSGIPSGLGSFAFTIRVTDNNGSVAEKSFVIEVALILPPSYIRISKSGTTAVPGRILDYFIVVQNAGNVTANDVEVAELLNPLQVSLVSVNPPAVTDVSTLADASFILWNIPTMAPGETKVLIYQVRLDPSIPFGTNVPGTACVGSKLLEAYGQCVLQLGYVLSECEPCIGICGVCTAICRVGPVPCLSCLGVCVECGVVSSCVTDSADAIACFREASQCEDSSSFDQPASGPVDPNEKGVIAKKFIQPDQLLVYPIHFENIGDVEARDVFITDHLDPNLDASTLSILTPGASYDPLTKTISWALLNVNLPPHATGNVLFSIKPLPGLPSGTEIRNDATIQFEVFEPITTNEVINIIDSTPPVCKMDSLPAETLPEFTLSWSGTDTIGEIETYSIFVSVDGQGFKSFMDETTDTSAVFSGEENKKYEFLCVAKDAAGNIEDQAVLAEVSTTVVSPNAQPIADAGEDQAVECSNPSATPVRLDASRSHDPDGDALGYLWQGIFGASNDISPTVPLPLGSHTITLEVNDGRGASDSDEVTIAVTDSTPPTLSAQWIPLDVEDAEGEFRLDFTVADICDPAVTVRGIIKTPSIDGLEVDLEIAPTIKIEFDFEENKLGVKGPDPAGVFAQLQNLGGLIVESGQIVQVETEEDNNEFEMKFEEKGILKIEVPSPALKVTGYDRSGNTTTIEAVPAFFVEKDDD